LRGWRVETAGSAPFPLPSGGKNEKRKENVLVEKRKRRQEIANRKLHLPPEGRPFGPEGKGPKGTREKEVFLYLRFVFVFSFFLSTFSGFFFPTPPDPRREGKIMSQLSAPRQAQ